MKFYRVFRDGWEGVGEVFTNKDDAVRAAQRRKRDFEIRVQDTISRMRGGGNISDCNFVAFECNEQGVRAF